MIETSVYLANRYPILPTHPRKEVLHIFDKPLENIGKKLKRVILTKAPSDLLKDELIKIKEDRLKTFINSHLFGPETLNVIRTSFGPKIFDPCQELLDLGIFDVASQTLNAQGISRTDFQSNHDSNAKLAQGFLAYLKDKPDKLNIFNLGLIRLWFGYDLGNYNNFKGHTKDELLKSGFEMVKIIANNLNTHGSDKIKALSSEDRLIISESAVLHPLRFSDNAMDHDGVFFIRDDASNHIANDSPRDKRFADALPTTQEFIEFIKSQF